ncbi:MAG: hypothetical protein OEW48_07665 [Phycisphaerae bacterium]|nr:hypothetical protein [Phycisphaerae bacterium]
MKNERFWQGNFLDSGGHSSKGCRKRGGNGVWLGLMDVVMMGVLSPPLIRPGVKHRFGAEAGDFRMLVVCFGRWKAEDQERHEDDYGRKGKKPQL